MIGLELSVKSDSAHRSELLQTLQNLRQEVMIEGVSHECRVFEDLSGPNQFLWLQWWHSHHQLQDYLRSGNPRVGANRRAAGLDLGPGRLPQ